MDVYTHNGAFHSRNRDVESQMKSSATRHRIWWILLVDLPLLVLVLVPIALFELALLPSHKAGFYCNDPALSFPYEGDSFSTSWLVTFILLAPLVTLFFTELIFADPDFSRRDRSIEASKRTLWFTRNYLSGLVLNLAVIEVMKGITGSPRPTFFSLCQPDAARTCVGSNFVSTFECTSTKYNSWMQADSYHSFPSGHTSLSVYAAIFIAWYLQRRAFGWRHRSVLVVPILQLAAVTVAALASLTRVTDRRHHWWDVAVGFVIGVATFLYGGVLLCKNLMPDNTLPKSIPEKRHCLSSGMLNSHVAEPTSP